MTIAQTARRLGVHPHTVGRWQRQGRLPAAVTTPGGHHRYDPDVVESMAAHRHDPDVGAWTRVDLARLLRVAPATLAQWQSRRALVPALGPGPGRARRARYTDSTVVAVLTTFGLSEVEAVDAVAGRGPTPFLLTTKEVAARLGVGAATVGRWRRAGHLGEPVSRTGTGGLVRASVVEELLSASTGT